MTVDGVCFAIALLSCGIALEIIIKSYQPPRTPHDEEHRLLAWGLFWFAIFLMITNGYPLWVSWFGPSSF